MFRRSHTIIRGSALFVLAEVTVVKIANNTNNALHDDGVTAPKYVGAVVILILM